MAGGWADECFAPDRLRVLHGRGTVRRGTVLGGTGTVDALYTDPVPWRGDGHRLVAWWTPGSRNALYLPTSHSEVALVSALSVSYRVYGSRLCPVEPPDMVWTEVTFSIDVPDQIRPEVLARVILRQILGDW